MFKLASDTFEEVPELQSLASYCLTETIMAHLAPYFEEGYDQESEETLYKKVKVEKTLKVFPKKMLKEMEMIGVNPPLFISKKLAQFMTLLNDEEDHVPDIFIEYMLVRFMRMQSQLGIDCTPQQVVDKKPELYKLLKSYANEYEGVDKSEEYAEEYTILATDFTRLLGVDEPDDLSLAFWDWDYMLFDDWGFRKMIRCLARGILHDYGLDYTKGIFTSIGEELPNILKSA